MTNRISGITGIFDTEALVSATLQPYKTKATNYEKEMKLYELKQEKYREVLTSTREFYNKYLTTGTSGLFHSSNYKSVNFTSSDEGSVTATALSGAQVGNYKVKVEKLAESAQKNYLNLEAGEKIMIGDQTFTLRGSDQKSIAKNLNIDIKTYNSNLDDTSKKINVTASYSDFIDDGNGGHNGISGIIIKSNSLGENSELAVAYSGSEEEYVNTKSMTLQNGEKVAINGVTVELSGDNNEKILENLKKSLSENKIDIDVSIDDGNIKFSSDSTNKFFISKIEKGVDAEVEITNNNGVIRKYKGESNEVVLDSVQFKFSGKTINENGDSSSVTLTGKTDVSEIKEKIKSFINDYNTLITDLNTRLSEKRYSDYMPLTSEEKADMNESDIKLWEDKVKSGLLRKDDDIQRIVTNMKSVMRTMMSDSGLKLESIGIEPVKDYSEKNGTFEIDEDTLTEALENNMDGVKELFTKSSDSAVNEKVDYYNCGILTGLQEVLDKEVMKSSTSTLIKKAGLQGSVTDKMSLELINMQKKLDDMNYSITKREQSLYSKYATLESTLSSLQSQQSSLASYFS